MERRALCCIQRNDAEGDGWGDALKEAKDDLQFALIDERVCISQNHTLSTIAGLFRRGVVDKQQSRERRQDERDGLRGGSVEKRGVVEESGCHIGDERVAAILRVQQKWRVYSSRGTRVETKGEETLKEGGAHRRDSFYPSAETGSCTYGNGRQLLLVPDQQHQPRVRDQQRQQRLQCAGVWVSVRSTR